MCEIGRVPRLYHSASSYKLGLECPRKRYYQYVKRLRPADVKWSDVAGYRPDKSRDANRVLWWRDPKGRGEPITSGQRGNALGTAMHDRLERWYDGGATGFDSTDLPGQIALSGLHLLPHPTKCHDGGTEVYLGDEPFQRRGDFDPPHVLRVRGTLWTGKIDLLAQAPAEFLRLGIDAPDGWALYDYKSSANIAEYALTPEELRKDFAANLYAYSTCIALGVPEIPLSWVYFETKDKRRAEARNAKLTLAECTPVVEEASERVLEHDAQQTEADAPCNTDACQMFGGCMYHNSRGGPCDAVATLGSLVKLRFKKKGNDEMALQGKAAAKFGGLKAGKTAPPPEEIVTADMPDQPEAEAEAEAEPAPAPAKTRAQRKPKQHPQQEDLPTVTVETGETELEMTIPGQYGAVKIRGHFRDVAEAVTSLLGG
jgi:hypothetical protein